MSNCFANTSSLIKVSKSTDTLIQAFNNQQMLQVAMECRGGAGRGGGGDEDDNGIEERFV
jgi:hypothetical protein